ncbi:MAG TPA: universal stress protein [Polyangiaceae bacterium]
MLIAQTTDLSGDDDVAFEHAVALAARAGARLATVHAGSRSQDDPRLPRAADVLSRWGLPRTVEQVYVPAEVADNRTDTLVDVLQVLQPDLLVCATHPRRALQWLLQGSTAEAMARNVECPTLLIPTVAAGFVDSATGALNLERMLIPAGNQRDLERAIEAAQRFAAWIAQPSMEVVVLHVGDEHPAPLMAPPPGFSLMYRDATGDIDARILDAVRQVAPSCVVMPTRGHDAVRDVLFGTHTERLLHSARTPVLWVPLSA